MGTRLCLQLRSRGGSCCCLRFAHSDATLPVPVKRVVISAAADGCRRWTRSLDGDELGTSGGTDTDLTVANRLVSHGEITEIFTNHVCLDFDGVPVLAGVDFADRSNHLGHDDGITEMGLDWLGLLTIWSFLDGLCQLLDQTVVTRVDSTSESSALSSLEHSDNFLGAKLEELVKFDTSVNLLFEWFSFGSLRGLRSCKFFLDRGHI